MPTITKVSDAKVDQYDAMVVYSDEPLGLEDFGYFIKEGIMIEGKLWKVAQIETFPLEYPYPAKTQFVLVYR